MSRTIRRKSSEDAFWIVKRHRHELKDEMDSYNQFFMRRIGVPKGKDPFEVWLKKKFHSDGFIVMRNPSWWNRLYGTVPLRAHNRALISQVMKLEDLEDTPIFMTRLKVPYYW